MSNVVSIDMIQNAATTLEQLSKPSTVSGLDIANNVEREWRDRHVEGVMAERQRIVNLLMIQHEAAKGRHNYWQIAAQLVQADVASDT